MSKKWPVLLLGAIALGGCGGGDSSDQFGLRELQGVVSLQLVRVTVESPGTNCPTGGSRVEFGVDVDKSGALDTTEVSNTRYVCNGEGSDKAHALVTVVAEPISEICHQGGARVLSGLDMNANNTLEPNEVSATSYACSTLAGYAASNTTARLLSIMPEAAGANCVLGGRKIAAGVDVNHDGMLETSEIISIEFECNAAADGADSTAFLSLVTVVTEPAGARCPSGGNRLSSGIDRNRNAVLDADEVTSTQYVCNGSPGANGISTIVSLLPEPSGSNCLAGGSRIASGPDVNGNGLLDANELASTVYVCNGLSGRDGSNGATGLVLTQTEPAGPNCPTGGKKITIGVDKNVDGVLQVAEISSTSYVCNGANSLLLIQPETAGNNCVAGGSRIAAGTDNNNNGVLDIAEVTSTSYACNAVRVEEIARYYLEESSWSGQPGEVKDSSGNNYHGTAMGSVLAVPANTSPALAGMPGTCGYAVLSGPTDSGATFDFPNLPVSIENNAETTVAFWMFWDGTPGAIPIGFGTYDLYLRGGTGFGFNTLSGDVFGVPPTALAGLTNSWHHVTATFKNGDAEGSRLYIDGALQPSTRLRNAPNNAQAFVTSNLRAGGTTGSQYFRFAGKLDDIRVFKGALSAADVAWLYSARHRC